MESLSLNNLKRASNLEPAGILPQPSESSIEIEELSETILSTNESILAAECQTISEAAAFITQSISDDLKVIGFEIKLHQKLFSYNDKIVLRFFNEIGLSRSILLIFNLLCNDEFLLCWKLAGSQSFFNLKIDVNHAELVEFMKKFIITSLKMGHNGLLPSINFIKTLIKIDVELCLMGDHQGLNLLSLAAKSGDIQTVKSLIKLEFDVQIAVDGRSAADFAYQEKHFDCLLELLRVNSLYPSEFNEIDASNEVKSFLKISTNLHNAIKTKNEEEVNEILTSNPHLRHFYDTENNSALTCAIFNRAFNIYEILILKNIQFGSQEYIEGIFKQLDVKSRQELRKIHSKHSQGLIKKHLIILMANSSIGHDIKNDQEKLNAVTKAYNVLDKDRRLSMILKVVAATRKFQITFDFKREFVTFLDPASPPYANGLFYLSGKILIGAKFLLEPGKEHIVYGVLAHELCHFAMFIIYRNLAKPYHQYDYSSKNLFETISKECVVKFGIEEIIDLVFENYPPETQHAELIVTIPHMIGHYCSDEETLNERKITMGSLFNYFDEKPMKAMEKALPEIEENAEKDIKGKYLKAEKKISKMRKIILILIIMLLFGIPFAAYYFAGPTKNWTDLSPEEQLTVKNNNVSYHGVFVRFGDLFAEDSLAFEKLDAYKIDSALKNKPKSLNQAIAQGLDNDIYLEWENSTKPLKEKILTSRINFQGEEIILNQILNETSKSLYNFTSSQVKNMHSDEILSIGSKFVASYKFFVERNFALSSIDPKRQKRETSSGEIATTNSSYSALDKPNYCFNNLNETEWEKVVKKMKSSNYHYKSEGKIIEEQLTKSMVINMTLSRRIFVLSDGPGSGKSTVFENLAVSIKKTLPTYFVVFIKLKDYSKVYQKNLDKELSELQNIADLISDKILELKDVESSMFKEMFLQDKVVFSWDALDEAGGGQFVEFLIKLFSKIYKNSKNIQLISTRPENSKTLYNSFGIEIHQLVPYDQFNRREYLSKLLSDLPSDKLSMVMIKIQKFIDNIEIFDREKIKTVNNPLMLQLISEVIRDNDEEIDLNNRYLVYQKFFDKKLRTITENHLKECVSFGVDFLTIYQIYAFKLIVPDDGRKYEKFDFNLTDLPLFQSEDLIDKKRAICQGILTVSSNSMSLEFIHRTYAEYFVAKYLVDSIYNMRGNPTESEIELRLKVLLKFVNNVRGVRNFLIDYFQNEETDERKGYHMNSILKELLLTKFSRTFHFYSLDPDVFAKEVLRRFILHDNELIEMMIFNRKTFANINIWMFKVFDIKLKDDFDSLEFYAESHQVGNIFYKIWYNFRVHQSSISELIRRFTKIPLSKEFFNQIKAAQTFPQFYDVVKDHLTPKDESEMYVKNYEKIFMNDLQKPTDYEYFILRFLNYTSENQISPRLTQKVYGNKNILHATLQITDSRSVEKILSTIEKLLNSSDIKKIILERLYNNPKYTPLDYACGNNDQDVLNVYWKFVKRHLTEENQKKYILDETKEHAAPLRHCRKSVFEEIISDDEFNQFCSRNFSLKDVHLDSRFFYKLKHTFVPRRDF